MAAITMRSTLLGGVDFNLGCKHYLKVTRICCPQKANEFLSSATANNGRRKELQQHFVLHLKLHGTLANGTKLVLSELTTAPIVVRGRSPRNFQARKEIPLLGSSAGSRGQTLVETGHSIVAQAVALNKPPYDSRPRVSSMDLPRTAFTFTSAKQMPQSPMQMRSK